MADGNGLTEVEREALIGAVQDGDEAAYVEGLMAEAWHKGHVAGVHMQHLIETGEDSWPDHLAVNPYGVPPSLT